MNRSWFAALVLPFALFACAAEAPSEEADEAVEVDVPTEAQAEARPSAQRVPFCPSGEKRSCTLGPPPVCTCVPITTTPPIVAQWATAVSASTP